jgi:hypothetical protein
VHKLFGTLALAATALQASVALADDQKSVIFEDTYLERGYTAFGARSANVLGESQGFASVLGGWHFTDRLVFGVRADALVSRVDTDVTDSRRLGITQLGLFGEYEVYRKDIFSFSASLGGGSGDAGYKVVPRESSVTAATGTETEYRHDTFTFVEPELTAAVHVSYRVDVALSVGYRSVRGLALEGVTSEGMKGTTTALMMRGNF